MISYVFAEGDHGDFLDETVFGCFDANNVEGTVADSAGMDNRKYESVTGAVWEIALKVLQRGHGVTIYCQ